MFITYKDRVVEAYQKQKEKVALSLNLSEPSPSKLKKESQIVYSERYKEKDAGILRIFFPVKEGINNYSLSIKNIDTDKFKPLSNFLKGMTSETEDKNVELLAWLIDFENRPYNSQFDYSKLIIEIDEDISEDENYPVIKDDPEKDVKSLDSENSGNSNKEKVYQGADSEKEKECVGGKEPGK